jgi:hypothetical protein
MLKHCAENRKIRLSALPNMSIYIYDVKISGFTRSSIYYISRLRVNCLLAKSFDTENAKRKFIFKVA